jgi:hypothetical protein
MARLQSLLLMFYGTYCLVGLVSGMLSVGKARPLTACPSCTFLRVVFSVSDVPSRYLEVRNVSFQS